MDPVLLIFIALALLVIFKLISVLGTRTGHEQRHELDPGEAAPRAARAGSLNPDREEAVAEEEPATAPKPVKPVSAAAAALQAADPEFDERAFLNGAKAAYEMIVEAFAAGDLKNVRDYLDRSVFEAFRDAVSAREAASQTVDLKFVGIEEARLVSGAIEDGQMAAVVEFVSNQVRTTFGPDGAVAEGDPNRIDRVKDRWTFSRPVRARDPNWTLTGTGGVGE